MNKIKGSIIYKLVLWIMAIVSAVGLTAGICLIALFESEGILGNTYSDIKDQQLRSISQSYANEVLYQYLENNIISDHSDEGFYFAIKKEESGEQFTKYNLNSKEYLVNTFPNRTIPEEVNITMLRARDEMDLLEWDNPIFPEYGLAYYGKNVVNSSNIYAVVSYASEEVWNDEITLSCNQILYNILEKNDAMSPFLLLNNALNWAYSIKGSLIFWVTGYCLIFIICVVMLIRAAGIRRGKDELVLTVFDKMPLDLFTLFILILGLCDCALIVSVVDNSGVSYYLMLYITVVLLIIDVILCGWYVLSIAVRVKNKNVFKNSIIYMVLHWIYKVCKYIWEQCKKIGNYTKTFWATAVIMLFVLFFELIAFSERIYELFTLTFFAQIVLTFALLKILFDYKRLQDTSLKIAGGDLNYQMDTKYMILDQKKFAENLNNISEGLTHAVDERMKSERMKTELITNVSHDIKTPLTSIINYVDLLQKEKIENDKAAEYLDVLARQSARLKKLIEDLVEASKASSGNLAVNVEKIDATVIISQVAGEFEEKLQKENLELIVRKPEPPVEICADGRHLWRVIENLMNNICKYAQPNSRVYLDLEKNDKDVKITLRNISKYQLDISEDELMERFVRGDSSRNTEGHGLGLSIAKSLMELMGGTLAIHVDGDLFKVVLTLKNTI